MALKVLSVRLGREHDMTFGRAVFGDLKGSLLGYIFYQALLKEKSNPRLKGNRKGIIVKDKEFYIPILNILPTR